MKNIFIILILVAVTKGFLFEGISTTSAHDHSNYLLTSRTAVIEPHFAELGGNLFLALQSNKSLNLEEGSIVKFEFRRNKSINSFHVDDSNQNMLKQGNADVLVMVHQDLALALKSEKLIGIKIYNGGEVISLKIDDFWKPHNYLTKI